MMSFTIFSTLLFSSFLHNSLAQFPRVCAGNATRHNAICCPVSPDDPSGPICGGQTRGVCSRLKGPLIPQKHRAPQELRHDDRLDWPLRFFKFSCVCKGNFWGYACHQCKTGWSGKECNKRQVGIRKNAFSLSRQEKRLFRDVLNRAKTELSDKVVLNITGHLNGDPVTTANLRFFNVTVYNYLIYLHIYAARSTLVDKVMTKCLDREQVLDFAHRGAGFAPWHRYYLMLVEAELTEIAKKYFKSTEPFMLPYWDWVDAKQCTICVNDLIGACNLSDPNARLDRGSAFYKWDGFCDMAQGFDVCHTCDPVRPQPPLWRTPSTQITNLPTQDDVNYLMSLTMYDTAPYNEWSNASSFRTVLEGFVDKRNNVNDTKENRFHMHNLVHSFMNGTWFDVATSPNDPLFWFHHSFVDKLFELWIRLRKASVSSLPVDTRPGHGQTDPAVPFFPTVALSAYMADSRSLGYDFDNEKAGSFDLKNVMSKEDKLVFLLTAGVILEGAILGLVVVILLIFALVYYTRRKRLHAKANTAQSEETTPLMDESGRSTRQGHAGRSTAASGHNPRV